MSVSELTVRIKSLLESSFPRVKVEGEVSNFRPASSGHWYFTLKDEEAVIQAVMFRNRIATLGFVPDDGMRIIIAGTIDVYAKRGTYQIVCDAMEHAGEGNLLAMLEERKRRLAAEGLFDVSRKRPLPLMPRRVAVITSPTGAAIRDILSVLKRRAAGLDIVIIPALVQGEGAGPNLASRLEAANRHKLGDVIILARGGGSIEDLLPFSDEVLVRAIAASETPVISAVGHEIDFSLCDFAADMRAPTPSAAAELVAASREELARRMKTAGSVIAGTWVSRTRFLNSTLSLFRPEELTRQFRRLMEPSMQRTDTARDEVIQAFQRMLLAARHRLDLKRTELNAISPQSVLERGYTFVTDKNLGIIRSLKQIHQGQDISIHWRDGIAEATISSEG